MGESFFTNTTEKLEEVRLEVSATKNGRSLSRPARHAIGTENWVGTPTMESLGNGWYQVRGSLDMSGADIDGIFMLWMGDNNNDVTLIRNGANIYDIHDFRVTKTTL